MTPLNLWLLLMYICLEIRLKVCKCDTCDTMLNQLHKAVQKLLGDEDPDVGKIWPTLTQKHLWSSVISYERLSYIRAALFCPPTHPTFDL